MAHIIMMWKRFRSPSVTVPCPLEPSNQRKCLTSLCSFAPTFRTSVLPPWCLSWSLHRIPRALLCLHAARGELRSLGCFWKFNLSSWMFLVLLGALVRVASSDREVSSLQVGSAVVRAEGKRREAESHSNRAGVIMSYIEHRAPLLEPNMSSDPSFSTAQAFWVQ